MSVANEIKIIRQKALLSQRDFAERLSVTFATVNRWETGKTIPKMAAMRKIKTFCDENNIPIDNLQKALINSDLPKNKK
ncbi:dNA-binding helix-turn-helix protein [Ruminococcus sp. CAG:382]|nr:dNA-binding helix-turn-helix protein [Ruminococcus sp. CAG:382]